MIGGNHEQDHRSTCAAAKSHSLMEVSTGLVFGRLFTVTTLVPSSSESSSESSDSDVSSSKFRDPATLKSQGFDGFKLTDPVASKLDVKIHTLVYQFDRTYHCVRCILASVVPAPCVNPCVLCSTNRRGAHLPSIMVYQSRDVHAFKWSYTDVVSYSKPLSRIIDVEHELLVRCPSRTEVRSSEDLERGRSISSEIPTVN